MSQTDIYHILRELGGKATSGQIKESAKEKYPDRTLNVYAITRLRSLEKKGVVRGVKKGRTTEWEITGEY